MEIRKVISKITLWNFQVEGINISSNPMTP